MFPAGLRRFLFTAKPRRDQEHPGRVSLLSSLFQFSFSSLHFWYAGSCGIEVRDWHEEKEDKKATTGEKKIGLSDLVGKFFPFFFFGKIAAAANVSWRVSICSVGNVRAMAKCIYLIYVILTKCHMPTDHTFTQMRKAKGSRNKKCILHYSNKTINEIVKLGFSHDCSRSLWLLLSMRTTFIPLIFKINVKDVFEISLLRPCIQIKSIWTSCNNLLSFHELHYKKIFEL